MDAINPKPLYSSIKNVMNMSRNSICTLMGKICPGRPTTGSCKDCAVYQMRRMELDEERKERDYEDRNEIIEVWRGEKIGPRRSDY